MKYVLGFRVDRLGKELQTDEMTLPMRKTDVKAVAVTRTIAEDPRNVYTASDVKFTTVTPVAPLGER